MECLKFFAKCVYLFLLLLASVLITLVQFLMWTCFISFKKFLSVSVKISNYRLMESILDEWGTLLADAGNKSKSAIVVVLKLNKTIITNQLEEIILNRVLKMKISNSTSLRYPNLRQYPSYFLGHWFWKNDEEFNIKKHIKSNMYPCLEQMSDELSMSFAHELVANSSFPDKMSPWNILILEGAPESCLVVVRVHHLMADGKSIVKLIVEGLGEKQVCFAEAKKGRESIPFYYFPLIPFYMIKFNFDTILTRHASRKHPWKVSVTDDSSFNVQFTKSYPLESIKRGLESHGNARTSAFLMAVISEVLQKVIYKFYENSSKWADQPIFFTLPKANHPEFLTNHALLADFVPPPLSSSSFVRALDCEKIYTNLREKSLHPVCADLCTKFLASLVRPLRKNLPTFDIYPIGMTNIAGEKKQFSIAGIECLDFTLSAIPTPSSFGIFVNVFSYMNNIRFSIVAKEAAMEKTTCQELVRMLEEDMNTLLN